MSDAQLRFYIRKYLNKKVDIVTDKGRFVGNLYHIGPNAVLGWELSITVDRTPAHIKEITSIKLYEEPASIYDKS